MASSHTQGALLEEIAELGASERGAGGADRYLPLGTRGALAARALQALGVTPEAVRAHVVERLRPSAPRPGGSLGVAPQTKRLLEVARTLAKRLGHRCARTEHLLLAAVSPALKSPAGTVLADCGADAARVCEQLASMLEMEAPELAARLRPRRRRLRGRTRVHSEHS